MIRIQIINGEIVLTVLIVLTDSQKEKVENKDLQAKIENIAADLKVAYAIEVNGNVAHLAISRTYSPIIYDSMKVTKDLVKASETFIERVTTLKVDSPKTNFEKKRVNCAKKVNDDVPYKEFKDNSKFIKKVLDELDIKKEGYEVIGCHIIAKRDLKFGDDVIQIPTPCGRISKQTLRRLLMVYLEYYKEYLCLLLSRFGIFENSSRELFLVHC